MARLQDPREALLSRVPPPARLLSGRSSAVPLELGALLEAAAHEERSLLAFAPPLSALASVSAGILRAAREHEASVVLRVDLAPTQGRGHAAVIEGICRACDAAHYGFPLGLVADVPVSAANAASGEAGRDIGEALAAGFPALILRLELPLEASALLDLLAPCRELGLGFGVAFAGLQEPEGLLAELRDLGVPLVAVLGDRELALAAHAFRWASSDSAARELLLDERPPIIEVPLALPADARGGRAEALAYFSADGLLSRWSANRSGSSIAAAIVAQPKKGIAPDAGRT